MTKGALLDSDGRLLPSWLRPRRHDFPAPLDTVHGQWSTSRQIKMESDEFVKLERIFLKNQRNNIPYMGSRDIRIQA